VSQLDAQQSAVARATAYHLLGTLLVDGVTDATLDHIRAVPDLARALPDELLRSEPGTDRHEHALDEVAAAFQDTFGFNVFPFQSTFLDETARAGGEQTERVTDFYHDAAFPVVETAESADHVGVELNFLGFSSKLEAETDENGAARARGHARRFLDEHLLRWLPALVFALRDHGEPFFYEVSVLALELAEDHRRDLADTDATTVFELPEAPDLLDDPKTGLRDIAEFLLVPAYTGFFLSRNAIRTLSHKERLPAGFGSRKNMLSNLLRSAAHYDGLQQVTAALRGVIDDHRNAWRAFGDSDLAVCRDISSVWRAQLERTAATIERIASAHAELAEAEPSD
jgi:TorA maturation chaperone TorD